MSEKVSEEVTYIGDPKDDGSGPSTIEVFGYEFKKNETVTLEESEDVMRKFRGHSHFVIGENNVRVEKAESDGLARKTVDELKDLAASEDVEIPENALKVQIIEAIRAAREANEKD